MPKVKKMFAFAPSYNTMPEILADHKLAALGDAYINLLYSLYLSIKMGSPTGDRADSRILSEALKRSGLKEQVASRADRHEQADAAEALMVYAWLQGMTTITECVDMMLRHEDPVEALCALLSHANVRLNL
jgi:uncharacterized protein YfaQ (DUF2300 family)